MSSTLISSLILLTSFIQTSNGQCESNFDCYPDISAPDLVNCSTATKSCVCSGCFEHQGGKCQVTNGCWKLNSEGTACEDLSDQIQYFWDMSIQDYIGLIRKEMSSTLISSLILLTSFIQTSNGQCESNFDCYPDISAPDLVNCSTATKSCVCSGCFEHQGGKCQVTNGCWKLNSEAVKGLKLSVLNSQMHSFLL